MKRKTLFLDVLAITVSFLISRWFYMEYLYFYSLSIFSYPIDKVDFWFPLAQIIIISLFLFTLLRCLYTKKLSLQWIYFLYFLYALVLLYVLFLKSVGIQGLNVNLFHYIRDSFTTNTLVPLFNLLLFIPLGLLVNFSYKNILKFLVAISCIEVCQYIFVLGIADVGDILYNSIGFIIGNSLRDSRFGYKLNQVCQKD